VNKDFDEHYVGSQRYSQKICALAEGWKDQPWIDFGEYPIEREEIVQEPGK
jgi:hypothetical protein